MKSFKTESQKVLDMMINSIYTNREIFLRELVSNANDAIDKLYYKSLSGGISGLSREDFYIKVTPDKEKRTLTIEDNGIGMTAEELDKNLGTIARSDTRTFRDEAGAGEDIDLIGQFGVGFYSAFMVGKKVEVASLAYGQQQANVWSSSGSAGYTVSPAERAERGTSVVITLKEDDEDCRYSDFLEEYRLREIIRKYSDYVRYPIMLLTKHDHYDDDGNVTESHSEYVTVNTMTPLWKKNKSQIEKEQYDGFYSDTFHDSAPLAVIHTSAEGAVDYKALLFIPSHAPYDFYTKNFRKGLRLYTGGVMINDCVEDLLPDYYAFVKGLVDCELSLNVSRETVQQNRQLKLIAANVEKKITAKLSDMLKNERENYEKFFKQFGLQLKYGVYSDWGMHKDVLQDLLLFYSLKQKKYVTFREYVDAMAEGQDAIYYASGATNDAIACLPQCEKVLQKGYDVLCLTDNVDEFAVKIIDKYADKPFRSVAEHVAEDNSAELTDDDKEMLNFIKDKLQGEVKDVKATAALASHPVCLTSEGALSIEMEKVLAAMPDSDGSAKADKVLEINVNHAVFGKLRKLYLSDKQRLETVSGLLYNLARLIEGLPVDNPTAFADEVCKLLAE